MALAAMRVYVRAIQDGDPEIATSIIAEGPDAIDMPNVHEATTPEQSMALDKGGARIIISASGMGSGGRVTHHLKALLPDRDNTVLLVGFQAVGTPGRLLLDGAHEIKIHGKYVPGAGGDRRDRGVLGSRRRQRAPRLADVLRSASRGRCSSTTASRTRARALAERIRRELDVAVVVPATGERIRV